MKHITNPYFSKAIQSVAKVVESNRFSVSPCTSVARMKKSLPVGLHEGRQGQLEPLEIEAIAQIFLQAVAPVLG
jgi:hypothetical protein